jgi:hypothetical protein
MSESPDPAVPQASEQAPPRVALFFDLGARDGRRVVEVRAVTAIANGFYASPRATIYSCAYSSQSERICALRRARLFCEAAGHEIVHFGRADQHRAAWQ